MMFRPNLTDEVLGLLRNARCRLINWTPHTIQLVEQLDESLFGVLKRRGQYKLPFAKTEATATFLFKIYRTVKQTMIEANIWGAFQELGFEFYTSREPYRLSFNEEKLRRSPRCPEISSLDFPFERLSTGRPGRRFDWIGQPE
jgi:hypothetical protein